jgi:hypothetical protein
LLRIVDELAKHQGRVEPLQSRVPPHVRYAESTNAPIESP